MATLARGRGGMMAEGGFSRAGRGVARPDVRAIVLDTGRADCDGVRSDVLVRAVLRRCHTGRAADTP